MKFERCIFLFLISVLSFSSCQKRIGNQSDRVKEYFCYEICEKNNLRSFNGAANVSKADFMRHLDIYERIREDFGKYDLTDDVLSSYTKTDTDTMLSFLDQAADTVYQRCGNLTISKRKINLFIFEMIGLAGTDRDKMRSKLGS